MSILTSPRLHFVGTMSWDPGLANNNSGLFDGRRAEVVMPDGVTNDTFPAFLLANLEAAGIWNLYGSHDAKFEHYPAGPNAANNTRVTSGRVRANGPFVDADPLLGKRVGLYGKLVDLDPEAVWNSQFFFDRFTIGDSTLGLIARRFRTMHSRWINFRRNLDRLDIAGAAGAIWQTVFPRDHLEFLGGTQSPLLNALRTTLANDPSARGLMLRFATYRTLYFQNGLLNQTPQQPRNGRELQQMLQAGQAFTNPAYSRVVGTLGVWHNDEPTSWPAGRYLVPAGAMPPLVAGGAPITLGPAVAEVDAATNRLVIDLLHAVPDLNRALDKVNIGPLTVGVQTDTGLHELGTLQPADYNRDAYERSGGIVELPVALTGWLQTQLQQGTLVISGQAGTTRVPLLVEERWHAVAEQRDGYLQAGEVTLLPIRVFEQGRVPTQPVQLLVHRYEGLTRTADAPLVLNPDADGVAMLELQHADAGPVDYGLQVVPVGVTAPPPLDRLDITAGQFVSTRTLPTDADLEAQTTDDQLTWEFIYDTVLRHWDLLNPIMTLRGLPLRDPVALKRVVALLLEVIDPANHEATRYMPITRDLSQGKRRLLQRWIDLQ